MPIIHLIVHVSAADAVLGDGRYGDLAVPVDLDQLTAEERSLLADRTKTHERRGHPIIARGSRGVMYGNIDRPDIVCLPAATHDTVVAHLRQLLEEEQQQAEEAKQREEAEAAEKAERRKEAERQAALPLAQQVCPDTWGHPQVVHPLRDYEDLRGPAEEEVRRLYDERKAEQEAEKAAKEAEKAAKEARRHQTLAAVIAKHLPDLSEAWEAGELAEREPADVVVDAVISCCADLPGGEMPDCSGTLSDQMADRLPAAAIRARGRIREELPGMATNIETELGLAAGTVTVVEGTPEWVTPYRPATEDERYDEEVEVDGDGDVRLPRALRLPLLWDVGGIEVTVHRVLETRD